MYEVIFYENRKGYSQVLEYMQELASRSGKESRVKLGKINDYIQVLQEKGTYAGKPYVDHLDGDIWELRPIADRILFAAWDGNRFVLLHQFVKKTQRTPKREIEKAKREFEDFKQIMKEQEGGS